MRAASAFTTTATVRADQTDVDPRNKSAALTLSAPAPAPAPPPTAVATQLVVKLAGGPVVGSTLRVVGGDATLTYKWRICRGTSCLPVSGAIRRALRIRRAWIGRRLEVTIRSASARAALRSGTIRKQ